VRGLPPRVAADQPHQLVDRRGIAVTASSPEAMEARLKPMEVLYITGHSLGAAMAAIETVLADLRSWPQHAMPINSWGRMSFGDYNYA
jgi:hypothetical protein